MSELQAISLRNVRSFTSQEPQIVVFDPRLTFIIGKNGTGKSTIFQVLRTLLCGIDEIERVQLLPEKSQFQKLNEETIEIIVWFGSFTGLKVTSQQSIFIDQISQKIKLSVEKNMQYFCEESEEWETVQGSLTQLNKQICELLGVTDLIIKHFIINELGSNCCSLFESENLFDIPFDAMFFFEKKDCRR